MCMRVCKICIGNCASKHLLLEMSFIIYIPCYADIIEWQSLRGFVFFSFDRLAFQLFTYRSSAKENIMKIYPGKGASL